MSTGQIRITNLKHWTDFRESRYKNLVTFPSTYNRSMATMGSYGFETKLEPLNVGTLIFCGIRSSKNMQTTSMTLLNVFLIV
jgi:hypothetical protein